MLGGRIEFSARVFAPSVAVLLAAVPPDPSTTITVVPVLPASLSTSASTPETPEVGAGDWAGFWAGVRMPLI
jgi:hypothetical protein